MTRSLARPPGRFGLRSASVFGIVALAALGCAGELDPSLLTGGGGSGGTGNTSGAGGTAAPCDAPTMVFVGGNCAQIGCHAAAGPAGGLDLASAGVAARLLDKPSATAANPVCAANTTPYLVSGTSPATGFLLDKLKNPPPCGLQMPELGAYTADEATCLDSWATALTTGAITP